MLSQNIFGVWAVDLENHEMTDRCAHGSALSNTQNPLRMDTFGVLFIFGFVFIHNESISCKNLNYS